MSDRDRKLGINRPICRRDFINGVGVALGGSLLSCSWAERKAPLDSEVFNRAVQDSQASYPPVRTGMRGSHPGSFEIAHQLREGKRWGGAEVEDSGEHYDLVVVGGGLSGLSAAWFYLEAEPDARILILDNHDDFGGHAKRNEFHHEGRMLLGLAGAQNLDNPDNYSETAGALMNDIGINRDAIDKMGENTPDDYLLGGQLHADVGLSLPGTEGHQTFGGHWLKFMHGRGNYAEAVRSLPIHMDQQDKLIDFFGGERDYLHDMSLTEKWDYVNSVSYNQFLLDRVKLTLETIPLLDVHLLNLNGPSGWQHSVLEAIAAGAPGLRALGWISNIVDSIGA